MMTSNLGRYQTNVFVLKGEGVFKRMSMKIIESYTVLYIRSIYLTLDDFIGISQGLAKGHGKITSLGLKRNGAVNQLVAVNTAQK